VLDASFVEAVEDVGDVAAVDVVLARVDYEGAGGAVAACLWVGLGRVVVVALDGDGEAFDREGGGEGEMLVEGAFGWVLQLHQHAVVGPA